MNERMCGAVELDSCINIVQIKTSSVLYYVKTGVETNPTADSRSYFIQFSDTFLQMTTLWISDTISDTFLKFMGPTPNKSAHILARSHHKEGPLSVPYYVTTGVETDRIPDSP